jgi:hypothetical protein
VRRALALAALLTAVPPTAVLLASAAAPAYDQVGLTAVLSGVRTDGTIGASGGLVTLDSGSAYVTATLDSSPSAAVLAAPYEPGTLARTGVGQVNGGAGRKVLDLPDAEARYPGQGSGSCCAVAPVSQGPLQLGAAQARAQAGPARVSGTATGAAYDLAGVLSAGPSTSTLTMTSDTAAGRVVQDARTAVSHLSVAGVLELDDVVATARITTDRDTHTAVQALTVGGATVAGQPVRIGNDGVTALGTPLLPGTTLEDATAQADARLAAAGISVHTVGGRTAHDARSASADTGGVRIDLRTADLPGGVAANALTVVVGGVALTELDTAFAPVADVPAQAPPAVGAPGTGSTSTTTVLPGTAGTTALPPVAVAPGPLVAAAPQVSPRAFVLAGRRISARTALAAFAGWQLLSLGTATLYALVERRRRLATA